VRKVMIGQVLVAVTHFFPIAELIKMIIILHLNILLG